MELSKRAGTWPERAHFSRVGSGSSWCFKVCWCEVKMPVQSTDDKSTVQWCQSLQQRNTEWEGKHVLGRIGEFWQNLSECLVILRSLDYVQARQASLSKTDSKISALVLATLLKSEDINNYLPQVINQQHWVLLIHDWTPLGQSETRWEPWESSGPLWTKWNVPFYCRHWETHLVLVVGSYSLVQISPQLPKQNLRQEWFSWLR